MDRYKKNKTMIQNIILVLYYISALPEITMILPEQGQWYTPMNQLRTITVDAMVVCALVTVVHKFLQERDKDKNILQQGISFVLNHIALFIPLIVFTIVCPVSKNTYQLKLFLFIIAMSDTDLDEHFKYLLVINVLFMFGIFYMYKIGMLSDIVVGRTGSDVVRHSYGYLFPLDFHGHLLSICFMYMYIRKEKFSIFDACMVNVANVMFYLQTDARMDMVAITLASILLCFVNMIGQEKFANGFIKGLCWIYTLGLTITPFLVTIFYNPDVAWMAKLNQIFSDRLTLQKRVLGEHGIPLFGKQINWVGWGGYDGTAKPDYNYVDCSFIRDTLDRGILFEIIFIIGCICLFTQLIRKKNITGVILMACFLFSCLTEMHVVLINFYPIMFLFSTIVMLSNKEMLGLFKKGE